MDEQQQSRIETRLGNLEVGLARQEVRLAGLLAHLEERHNSAKEHTRVTQEALSTLVDARYRTLETSVDGIKETLRKIGFWLLSTIGTVVLSGAIAAAYLTKGTP